MIFGVGTDMMDVKRMEKELQRDNGLMEKVFTPYEIDYCRAKANPYMHFAARYAAKEAFLKAMGTGWRNGLKFTDAEVRSNKLGKPVLKLLGKAAELAKKNKFKNIQLSISHLEELANAIVIIEI